MAIVSSGYYLTISFVESSGKTTTRRYKMNAATAATAETDAAAALPIISALTDAVVGGYTVQHVYVENDLVLPTDVELEDQAIFTHPNALDPRRSATTTIPAPVDGIFVSATGKGRDQVNLSNQAVIDYGLLFTIAGTLSLAYGETSLQIDEGRRRSVKSFSS